jgi:predicted site-specific integrase-resolvase
MTVARDEGTFECPRCGFGGVGTERAAEMLGVSDQTVRNYVKWGLLDAATTPMSGSGSRLTISRSSIDEVKAKTKEEIRTAIRAARDGTAA